MSHLNRRSLLKGAAVFAALPVIAWTPPRNVLTGDPFGLGVASGEPTADGVVLWTRLAPDPLAEDGYGGSPARTVDVDWQVADDEAFIRIVQSGRSRPQRAPDRLRR